MNAFVKSTTLLLAAFATPLATHSIVGDDQPDAGRGRKGPGAMQRPAKPQAETRQLATPSASRQVGGPMSGRTQQLPKLNVNTPRPAVQTSQPLANGNKNRQPTIDKPVVQLPSGKPAGFSRKPANISRPAVDLSHKVGHGIDMHQPGKGPGKAIDPGFNGKRLPQVDLPKRDREIVRVPLKRLPQPHGIEKHSPKVPGLGKPHSDHGPKVPDPLADGHKLHMALPGVTLADRMKKGDFHKLVDSKAGKQLDLKKQFELHQHGDLARKLNLGQNLALHGGWQKRFCGPVDPLYTQHGFSACYSGPSYYPSHCWFPQWTPWVNWCWDYACLPICDPRPIYCRPIYYDPCVVWGGWSYPIWSPMPVVTCGTWIDVPTVVVTAGYDVQLLAVRFVDPGHPDQNLGPRYRVWVRNNSPVAIAQPFNLVAYASNDREPGTGLPEVGLRIQGMEAGQIQSVDVRLPVASNSLFVDAEGRPMPFQFLHLIADSHREVPEAFEENNGSVIARGDILPIDPALFAADSEQLVSGAVINIAGEGFGPEPGQVLVNVGGLELQAEIVGWCDLGVQVRLPALTLTADAAAELVVVRGDQAASNPLTLNLTAMTTTAQTITFQSP